MSLKESDTGLGFGLEGTSTTRIGIIGKSNNGPGVLGESDESFEANPKIATQPVGVMGVAKAGPGVVGFSEKSTGVSGASVAGVGIYGLGVVLEGVRGLSGQSHGVSGVAAQDTGCGVLGTHVVDGYGVAGISQGGDGVYGETDSQANQPIDNPGSGVFGYAKPHGCGVYGYSPRGPAGILGLSDDQIGVFGQTNAVAGTGIYGRGGDGGGGIGVAGQADIGIAGNGISLGLVGSASIGVQGNGSGIGIQGNSTGYIGVQGDSTALGGTGVVGSSKTGNLGVGVSGDGSHWGVMGEGGFYGVMGTVTPLSGVPPASLLAGVAGFGKSSETGVYGNSENGSGVWGQSTNGSGVEGYSTAGHAGWFNGDVNITKKLTKAGGGFRIDHPQAPGAMYLNHSFVESPDMKNLYDGMTVLGQKGEATVELPRWFEALNCDFRYQLTAIGAPAPGLYIASEIRSRRFRIAGGRRGMKICWQVTGTRKDVWANAHRMDVEEKKTGNERGKFCHPELFGKPEELSIQWARDPKLLRMLLKHRKRGASLMTTWMELTNSGTPGKNRAPAPSAKKSKGHASTPQALRKTRQR